MQTDGGVDIASHKWFSFTTYILSSCRAGCVEHRFIGSILSQSRKLALVVHLLGTYLGRLVLSRRTTYSYG